MRRRQNGNILIYCHASCTYAEICKAIEFPVAALFAERKASDIENAYTYLDDHDKPSRDVVRRTGKCYFQRGYSETGEVRTNVRGIPMLPYHLSDLKLAIANGWPVYAPEGERDVETLLSWGLNATTSPGGASVKWPEHFVARFTGADVCVVADADRAGRKAALERYEKLLPIARSVQIIDFGADASNGFDCTNFFEQGGSMKAFLALAKPISESSIVEALATSEKLDVEIDFKYFSKLHEAVKARTDLSPAMKLVYADLARNYEYRQSRGKDVFNMSFSKIAARCALSARGVKGIIRALDDRGFITRTRTNGARQQTNAYEILRLPAEPSKVKAHRLPSSKSSEANAPVECVPFTRGVNKVPAYNAERIVESSETNHELRKRTLDQRATNQTHGTETAVLRLLQQRSIVNARDAIRFIRLRGCEVTLDEYGRPCVTGPLGIPTALVAELRELNAIDSLSAFLEESRDGPVLEAARRALKTC